MSLRGLRAGKKLSDIGDVDAVINAESKIIMRAVCLLQSALVGFSFLTGCSLCWIYGRGDVMPTPHNTFTGYNAG